MLSSGAPLSNLSNSLQMPKVPHYDFVFLQETAQDFFHVLWKTGQLEENFRAPAGISLVVYPHGPLEWTGHDRQVRIPKTFHPTVQ